jgi:acetyl esterase/lipase
MPDERSRSDDVRSPPGLGHTGLVKQRRTAGIAIGVAALGSLVSLAVATPWPSALLIRAVFGRGARGTVREMLPYVPAGGVSEHPDIVYGAAGGATSMDVFSPATATGPLPAIVWIHGGAWISGGKEDVAPYLRILASRGYTAIGLNYTIAPEAKYPTALTQLNRALGYISEHAAELNVDPGQIVLAGDSAGAQLASQLAVLTTNPEYARLLGIVPSLAPSQLAGTILHCGVYDLEGLADLEGVLAWGFQTALWGYTGVKDWSRTDAGEAMSTIRFVNGDFPPTFISGGNGDGLTRRQSVPMNDRLEKEGIDVTALFWASDHEPALPHEYQFHLDYEDARIALEETLAFLGGHTRSA